MTESQQPDPPRPEVDATAPPSDAPLGLGEQIGRTRASFKRLFQAHIGLLRAEMGEIIGQIKIIASQAGIALFVALAVGNLLFVGGFLFLGEWLFGSIGWGLAHGVLFGVAIIVVLVLGILGASARRAAVSFLLAVLTMIGLALLAGSNVGHNSASYLAEQLAAPLNSAGVVALLAGALVGALLFMVPSWRLGGRSGALGGLVVGAILGLPLGWLVAGAPWTWPPAVGFAITVGLLLWPFLAAVVAWPGLDPAARFAKLYPRQSIEAANETKAWLEEQWQTRRPKRGKN